MTSPASVETVRAFLHALASYAADGGSEDAVYATMDADVVYVEDPMLPGSGTHRGVDAVRACWNAYEELLGAEVAIETIDLREVGDQVVARVRIAGQTTANGVPYDHVWGYTFRIRDERITYFRAHFDPAQAG